ncbi:NAD(P)/FAD-dependent oxidoreductase [uncultured Polaribacter sp.]|uniref:NAD(P)/FAD-dependent oxidoreductase n=1 Tax=uncultured Polaribacter sp. TaxID=174711 RepID=UPI0026109CFF|nr:NAD(P)/FAD-dependent oxidoreductase [uncultured Polaribacter sp.]
MTVERFDVVVIGAGPAGGQTARSLAKKGVSVVLVEKHKNFSLNNFSSAGMTLEPIDEFNIPESVVGAYWKDLVIQCTKEAYTWQGNTKKGVVLDFKKLREFLADETIKHGGKVLMGYKYESKEIQGNEVTVLLSHSDKSKSLKIETKLLVDATGPLRKVMYDANETQPEMVLGSGTEYEIEVEQEVYDKFKDKLLFFLGHKWAIKGYSWIFPMQNRVLKVGAGKTHIKSKDQEKTNKTTRKITEKIISEYIKSTNYKILDKHGGILRYSIGLKDTFYNNKVVAVGDAVSAINPRGGEGIRYAMQTGELVSNYIVEYLTTGKENFDEYQKKWRKKTLLKWKLSEYSGRRMYSRYTDNQIENRVKFFRKNFTIDDMIDSLFNFKYNKLFTRIFQYSFLKIQFLFKKEKF